MSQGTLLRIGMKAIIVVVGLTILAGAACHGADQSPALENPTLEEAAQKIMLRILTQLIESEPGKKYFAGVDPGSIQLCNQKSYPGGDGWIVRWGYAHKVETVKNPNRESPRLVLPVINALDGIRFELFIGYKHGDGLVGRVNNFTISENPRCVIGYDLMTKHKDKQLIGEINVLCEGAKSALSALVPKAEPK